MFRFREKSNFDNQGPGNPGFLMVRNDAKFVIDITLMMQRNLISTA